MRGIEVPERTEDFTADPVELFFDLAYVFAFSQLVGRLIADHTWGSVGEVTLLFLLLWLPWQQFTWSANAVSGNGRPVRIVFLLATVTSIPMAASMSTAFGDGGPVFAVSVAVIFLLGAALLVLGLPKGTSLSESAVRWIAPNLAAIAVLVAGSYLDGDARTIAWVVTVGIVFGAMAAAGKGEWIVRSGHFAERHGLIIIVALGEVIVAIGLPVITALETGEGLPAKTLVALVASGAFAALLWWSYFDRPGPALEHRAESIEGDNARGRFVRDVYGWFHAPLALGIVFAAAALEEVALHPSDAVPASFRTMLFGGLAMGAAGISASVWRAFRVVARERLVATAVIAVVLASAGSVDGVVLLVGVDLILLATLLVEHIRIEGPVRPSRRNTAVPG
jgi:low temperature requirement protein LtrA